MTKAIIISRIHLIISVFVVIPAAFIYGFNIDSIFNIDINSVDEKNFTKGVMGLYLAFAVLWVLGISFKSYFKIALFSNIMFMLGLAFGRLLSIITDGIPSSWFALGMLGEFVLGFYGLWVIKRNYTKKP